LERPSLGLERRPHRRARARQVPSSRTRGLSQTTAPGPSSSRAPPCAGETWRDSLRRLDLAQQGRRRAVPSLRGAVAGHLDRLIEDSRRFGFSHCPEWAARDDRGFGMTGTSSDAPGSDRLGMGSRAGSDLHGASTATAVDDRCYGAQSARCGRVSQGRPRLSTSLLRDDQHRFRVGSTSNGEVSPV
jgi:hypothetical protein